MSVKKNLIANYLGVGWSALMSIAFVPFYLRFIGAEGYGLVGFFVMLSASLSILDAGLAAVATREAAGYLGAKESRRLEIVTLLRTIELVFLAISLVVGLLVSLASPLIVKYWLNVPVDKIAGATWAVSWMGLSIAIQFLTSLYTGCLNGFQKQVGLNVINVVGSTVRGVGAILVLWLISPTVQTFFAWQAIGGAGMLVAQRILFVREMHATPVNFGFSLKSLKRVRHFMAGMGAINILALLLTQLDKIILSKVLSLEAFGHYSLAWMLGTLIYRLTGPVFNSYYPRITQLLEQKNTELMLETYQRACKVMAVVVVPISLWLALYSYDIIELWTRNSAIANQAAGALSILAIGTMLNAFMHIPYAMQLAHSYTRLALAQNIVAVILLAPLTWFFATHYGLTETALPWLLVNLGYVLIGAPLMHIHLVIPGLQNWYCEAVLKPTILSGCSMLLTANIWESVFGHEYMVIMLPINLFIGFLSTILNSRLFSFSKLRQWKNS